MKYEKYLFNSNKNLILRLFINKFLQCTTTENIRLHKKFQHKPCITLNKKT